MFATNITGTKLKKYLEYKNTIQDKYNLIYKIIILIFDNRITKSYLDTLKAEKVYYLYSFIEIYIKEIIINKFKILNKENIELEESVFDSYDKENGYILEKNELTIYENLLEALNNCIRFSIKQCKNSLKESLDMNICDLLDYIKYEIEYIEEHKDDEKDNLD